jgi:hypothetical protein
LNGEAHLYLPGEDKPRIYPLTQPPTLAWLQILVDGWLEHVE